MDPVRNFFKQSVDRSDTADELGLEEELRCHDTAQEVLGNCLTIPQLLLVDTSRLLIGSHFVSVGLLNWARPMRRFMMGPDFALLDKASRVLRLLRAGILYEEWANPPGAIAYLLIQVLDRGLTSWYGPLVLIASTSAVIAPTLPEYVSVTSTEL